MQVLLNDKRTIAALQAQIREITEKYPLFAGFLEEFCGYNTPGFTADPQEIAYAAGKRDVILTVKTLMRTDITPEAIAKFYEELYHGRIDNRSSRSDDGSEADGIL